MIKSKIILLISLIILIISCKRNHNLKGFTNINTVEKYEQNSQTNMTKIRVAYMEIFLEHQQQLSP